MADDVGAHDDVVQMHNMPSKVSQQTKSSFTEDGQDLRQMPTYRQPRTDSEMTTSEKATKHSSIHMLSHDEGLEHYFVGPRDLDRHSKLPFFMRMHGSILPKMLIPLLLIGGWATVITVITKYVHDLGISNILLTVLGFVVGLALSFRSSTAYERYADGRKAWSSLTLTSRTLSRLIWIHIREREEDPELHKQDVLAKLSAINLVRSFAIALKHKLRFEPYAHYDDILGHVGHLDTFAKAAYEEELLKPRKKTPWKAAGEYLGIPFAESNPRKFMKRAKKPVGNLPLEIVTYLSAYLEDTIRNGTTGAVLQGQLLACVASLVDVMTQTERVLNTPLPEAYTIAFSQITLMYILTLPFQLVDPLGWICIPGTVGAAYIILGLATIGHEIENPFGHDVNDLPLDRYCQEISMELDIITSCAPPSTSTFVNRSDNLLLYPLSMSGHDAWERRSLPEIRDALKAKTVASMHRKSCDVDIDSDGNLRVIRGNGSSSRPVASTKKGTGADVTVTAVASNPASQSAESARTQV